MTRNTRLKEIAVAIYLLVIPLVLYFKYFPTIVNSLVTNALFLALLSILAALLVYGSFLIKESRDVYLLLPQTLMIAFVVRAAPNLRLAYTFLHDPYFHYITATNTLNFGVTNAGLSWWYSNIYTQLLFPLMHLLTVTTVLTSGIDIGLLFRFQEPVLGALFVLAVFILARLALKNDGQALLSALIALGAQSVIFFQSEYHPQGLAFIYFAFLVYAFLKIGETKNRLMYGPFLVFLGALVLSHAFSSLFVGLFALFVGLFVIGIVLISPVLARAPGVLPEFRKLLRDVSRDYTIWLLIAALAVTYQAWGSFRFFREMIGMAQSTPPPIQLLTVGQTVPLSYTFSNAVQYIWLLLAGVSLVLTVRTQSRIRVKCAILTAALLVVGLVGWWAAAIPVDRIIGFYTPLGALFVALTVFSIKDQWFPSVNKSLKTGLLIVLICLPIVAGVTNSQVPAFFFKDSNVNTFYWSSNDLSSANRQNTTGTWIYQHVPDQKAIINSEFDTLPAVFYFGIHPAYVYSSNVSADYLSYVRAQYVVVNPSIPYSGGSDKAAYLNTINVVFDDGKLNVGQINGQSITPP